ncbi:MAG: NEW3 domain-containing protein [Dethiobacteria bacterium]|nr:alpha-galactosidase [Bacillota bacterium]
MLISLKRVSSIKSFILYSAIAALVLMLLPLPAHGQQTFSLSTTYPGIAAMPGEKIVFPLNMDNAGAAPRVVELKIVEAPEGWDAVLRGNGKEIHKVQVRGNEEVSLDLEVEVPVETKAGTYRFLLEASAGNLKSTLPLEVRITESGEGIARLESEYPVLRGPSGAEFRYRVELTNDSAHEQMFSLFVEAPPGWSSTIKPTTGSEQIASISLEPGKTERLDINVKSPESIEAGEYPIKVHAAGKLTSATANLEAVITGTYELNVTTPSGRLNAEARAGSETPLKLLLENRGSSELHNITLSADTPNKWTVDFEPARLDLLPAGETVEVIATIKPDGQAIAGDYVVTINAKAEEAMGRSDFRVTVLTSTLWGLIGVIAVLAVVAGLFTVFRIYGRR